METNFYNFTANMKNLFEGEFEKMPSCYCREDFEIALNNVLTAKKDNIIFERSKLEKMCASANIDADKLIEDRTLLNNILTRSQLRDKLLENFYNMCKASPDTMSYMERLVRRLAPEYNDDTVRTAILKKFMAGSDKKIGQFRTEGIIEWGKEKLSDSERREYEAMSKSEQRKLIISKIDDSIFECIFTEFSSAEHIHFIASRLVKYKNDDNIEFDELTLSEQAQHMLDGLLDKYSLNGKEISNIDKVLKVSEALKDNVIQEEEILTKPVEAIEDDLCSQLKKISAQNDNKNEEDGSGKSSGKNSLVYKYKQAKKDRMKTVKNSGKRDKPDRDLLEMCHNLAEGNFKKDAKTRMYLYYFAFMFNMTVSVSGYNEYNAETDIVKNLFHDYYNDNILRFFNGMYTAPESDAYAEKMPTGEGINYKNFAEVIYIYYLNKRAEDSKMLPGEGINKAEGLINKCVKTAKERLEERIKKGEPINNDTVVQYTYVFKSKIAVMLDMDENQLHDYIVDNYHVVVPNKVNTGRINIDSEEVSAFELISEIMEELDESYYVDPERYGDSWKLDNEEGRSIREDIEFETSFMYDWNIKRLLEEKYSDDEAFMKILAALDERTAGRKLYFTKMEKTITIALLHILASQSGSETPLSMDKIKRELKNENVFFSGMDLQNAVKILMNLGYDIKKLKKSDEEDVKDSDEKKHAVKYCYYLDSRRYDNSLLNEFLFNVSGRYITIDDSKMTMLTKLFEQYFNSPGRVTRTDMIVFHFYNYVLYMDANGNRIYEFSELFEDYSDAVDPILEDARYQRISHKNIFDMYIVTALYLHMLDNDYEENQY